MKNDILQLIKNKKSLFKQELKEGALELQKMKEEMVKKDKREAALLMMERIPILKTKIVSAKVVVAVLTELEKEIDNIGQITN